MGKTLAVANQKGGVGKTTTVVNLSAALARIGHSVLLVDSDPQGHLTLSAGVRVSADMPTLYELLMDDSLSVTEAIIPCNITGVSVIPANSDLAGAEVQLVDHAARHGQMTRILRVIKSDYDFILLDCPHSLSLLTINAMTAADRLLVPLECSFLATQGLRELLDTYERVQEHLNPHLKITGILLTMYDSRTLHSREVVARVREAFPNLVFEVVIPHTVRFREAPVVGQSLLDYAPRHPGAEAYLSLAEEVIHRES